MEEIFKGFKVQFVMLILGLLLTSCSTTQNAVYFSDLDSLSTKQLRLPEFNEPIIKTDDIINVNIQTLAESVFSLNNETNQDNSGNLGPKSISISGFLVDKKGEIEMPMLGIIKLSGLTISQAKELIREKALRFYKEPTVQVRFANYKITVLGEVAKPSTYTVPNEKVTILDAISMAGDLTIFGKRNNVLLIRDNGATKDMVRLNLNSSQIISSPYFYLKQNDILYIEPTKAKVAANNAPRNQLISIGIAVATLLVTIATRL